MKRLFSSDAGRNAVGLGLGAYMRAAGRSARWQYDGLDIAQAVWAQKTAVILACWHGRLMLFWKGWDPKLGAPGAHVLISQSKEGAVVARAGDFLGYGAVRGSSAKGGQQKGGSEALRELIRLLKAGESVCVTPDGPRGPGLIASAGIAQLARLSGAPVLPMSWSVRGQRILDRWDRFAVPPLFGRAALVYGPLMQFDRSLPGDEGIEAFRLAVERELTRLDHKADTLVGNPPALGAPA